MGERHKTRSARVTYKLWIHRRTRGFARVCGQGRGTPNSTGPWKGCFLLHARQREDMTCVLFLQDPRRQQAPGRYIWSKEEPTVKPSSSQTLNFLSHSPLCWELLHRDLNLRLRNFYSPKKINHPLLYLSMDSTHFLSPRHFTLLMIPKVIRGFLCHSNGVGTEASLRPLLARDTRSHLRIQTVLLPHRMSKTDNDF